MPRQDIIIDVKRDRRLRPKISMPRADGLDKVEIPTAIHLFSLLVILLAKELSKYFFDDPSCNRNKTIQSEVFNVSARVLICCLVL